MSAAATPPAAPPGARVPAGLCLVVAALGWSLGVWLAAAERLAGQGLGGVGPLVLVIVGGMAQTLALWTGFAAVLWAMVRACGGLPPLAQVLWLGAPAGDARVMAGLALAAGLLFLGWLLRDLARALDWGLARATLPVAAAMGFVASVFTLAT